MIVVGIHRVRIAGTVGRLTMAGCAGSRNVDVAILLNVRGAGPIVAMAVGTRHGGDPRGVVEIGSRGRRVAMTPGAICGQAPGTPIRGCYGSL